MINYRCVRNALVRLDCAIVEKTNSDKCRCQSIWNQSCTALGIVGRQMFSQSSKCEVQVDRCLELGVWDRLKLNWPSYRARGLVVSDKINCFVQLNIWLTYACCRFTNPLAGSIASHGRVSTQFKSLIATNEASGSSVVKDSGFLWTIAPARSQISASVFGQ